MVPGSYTGAGQGQGTVVLIMEMDYGRIERRIIATLTNELPGTTLGFTTSPYGPHPFNRPYIGGVPNLQITEINEKMFERDRDRSYDWFRDFEHIEERRERIRNLALRATIRRGQARADIGQSRRHKRKKYLQSLRNQT